MGKSIRENLMLVQVFAGTYLEASLIRGMLESNGLRVFLEDEALGSLAPWHTAPGGAGAVKVLVAEEDREIARSLIEAPPETDDRASTPS